MSRDYQEIPCPECGGKNVEQKVLGRWEDGNLISAALWGFCYHCPCEWRIQ